MVRAEMGLLGLQAGCLGGDTQIFASMKYLIGCKEEGGRLFSDVQLQDKNKLLCEGAQTLNSLPIDDSISGEIQDHTGRGPEKPASVVSALTRGNWTRSSEVVRDWLLND